MAMTHERALQDADAIVDVANQLAALPIHQLLEFNADQAIDWGNATKPAFLNEDADGNLTGRKFTRQQISNVVGTLALIRDVLNNVSLTGGQGTIPNGYLNATGQAGDHLGNLNAIARPLG